MAKTSKKGLFVRCELLGVGGGRSLGSKLSRTSRFLPPPNTPLSTDHTLLAFLSSSRRKCQSSRHQLQVIPSFLILLHFQTQTEKDGSFWNQSFQDLPLASSSKDGRMKFRLGITHLHLQSYFFFFRYTSGKFLT